MIRTLSSFEHFFQVEIFTKEVVKSDENSKITVQNVKDYLHVLKEQFAQRERKQQAAIDAVKTLESTLSTKLPADRYNGLINLLQVFINPDSTSAEIENALVNYILNDGFFFSQNEELAR